MWSFQKSFLFLTITFTFLVMAVSQEDSGEKYTMEEIANIIQKFNETFEADKLEKVPVLLTVTLLDTFQYKESATWTRLSGEGCIEFNCLNS